MVQDCHVASGFWGHSKTLLYRLNENERKLGGYLSKPDKQLSYFVQCKRTRETRFVGFICPLRYFILLYIHQYISIYLGLPVSTPTSSSGGGLDSLLNGVDALSFATTSSQPPFTVYEKHGLRINFTFPSQTPGKLSLVEGTTNPFNRNQEKWLSKSTLPSLSAPRDF